MGRIGFEGRFDYAAIGSVTNLAARLCDVGRGPWQVLASPAGASMPPSRWPRRAVGELELSKGFGRPVRVFDVTGVTTEHVKSKRQDMTG